MIQFYWNGAMEQNYYQGIADIRYNMLNLPQKIQFMDGHQTQYSYDAAGIKHKVVHTTVEGNVTVPLGTTDYTPDTARVESTLTTEYFGNIVYEDGVLKYILNPEGYAYKDGSTWKYNYYLKDHLGNNRVVMELSSGSATQKQKVDYYPFGYPYPEPVGANYEWQRYKFGGKELDEMHGLNWYDFHARQYNSVIPVFGQIDQSAEKYYNISPYAYCLNNPLKYVDVDGKEPRIYVETQKLGHTFITTGAGANTTVYTYGRFGGLDANKSSARDLSRTGEGVLIIMKGDEALNYITEEVKNKGASIYEIKNGSDEKIDAYFNDMFNSSDQRPSGDRKYSNAENAKVVDKYDLFNNNCTTKSVDAVKIGTDGKLNLKSKSPANINTKLYYENQKKDGEIQQIFLKKIYDEYNDDPTQIRNRTHYFWDRSGMY